MDADGIGDVDDNVAGRVTSLCTGITMSTGLVPCLDGLKESLARVIDKLMGSVVMLSDVAAMNE